MTQIISHIFAFSSGLLIATLILWAVHRKQKQDWQAEYRRLMWGIEYARVNVLNLNHPRASVAEHLRKMYNDEVIWPRG